MTDAATPIAATPIDRLVLYGYCIVVLAALLAQFLTHIPSLQERVWLAEPAQSFSSTHISAQDLR